MPTKSAHKSWKKDRNIRKSKSRVKLAFLVLSLILLVLATGSLIRLTKSLFTPLSAEEGKREIWDGTTQLNISVKSKDTTSVLSFDPNLGTLKVVTLSGDVYVNVPKGRGDWQIRSVYELGTGENPPEGGYFLKKSLVNYLGLPIDNFLVSEADSPEKVVGMFRSQPWGLLTQLSSLKTDLTPIELFRLYTGIMSVRFDKITYLTLGETDSIKIDDFVSRNLFDSQLKEEQATIAVFNGTKVIGRASQFARLINNLGGNVIIQSNFEKDDIKSTFMVSSEKNYTSKRLERIFSSGCPDKQVCDRLKSPDYSRAQVNVVLGQD